MVVVALGLGGLLAIFLVGVGLPLWWGLFTMGDPFARARAEREAQEEILGTMPTVTRRPGRARGITPGAAERARRRRQEAQYQHPAGGGPAPDVARDLGLPPEEAQAVTARWEALDLEDGALERAVASWAG